MSAAKDVVVFLVATFGLIALVFYIRAKHA